MLSMDETQEKEFRRALFTRARNGDRQASSILWEEYGVTVYPGTSPTETESAGL
ncbi:MAG: hypothetical protein M3Z35_14825 [Nitrospirota bacterium]|nr:hypothetical protein [Nitrospirota bacterium]